MKTVEGYSKEKYTDTSVLLAGGGAAAISGLSVGSAGTATYLTGQTPQIAASSESNEVTIKDFTTSQNFGSVLGSYSGARFRKGIDFRWYATHWLTGILRSGDVGDDGYAIAYSSDSGSTYALKLRLDKNGNLFVANNGTFGGTLTSNSISASTLTVSGAATFSTPISGDLLGNATTADRLKNAVTINGVSFDGSGNITITAVANGGNADTLDSLHESSFFRKNLITTSIDCNSAESNSFTILNKDSGGTITCSNKPSDASIAGGYGVLTVNHGAYSNQIFFPYSSDGSLYTRGLIYNSGVVWGDWKRIALTGESQPASDVYSWAKASSKPSYAFSEITGSIGNTLLPTRLQEYITSAVSGTNGFGRMSSGSPFATFISSSNSDCMLVTTAYSASWQGLLALDYRSNNIAYRNDNNGTWNSWALMLSSANYSSYALPLSGGTLTGSLYGPSMYPTYLEASTLKVNGASTFVNTPTVGGLDVLLATSSNRHGVTKLYRNDSDTDYSVQTYWNGSKWVLYGYAGNSGHAGCLVSYSDSSNYSNYPNVTSANEIRINSNGSANFDSSSDKNDIYINYAWANSAAGYVNCYLFQDGHAGFTSIKASKFITNNGTAADVVLGDGTLKAISSLSIDDSTKLPLAGGTMTGKIKFVTTTTSIYGEENENQEEDLNIIADGFVNIGTSMTVLGDIIPYTDNSYTLGTSGRKFSLLYATTVNSVSGCYETSDIRKKNILNSFDLNLSYDFLNNCNPFYFKYKDIPNKTHIGLSAQEVLKYFPEVVTSDNDGYLSVDYAKLSVICLSIIKDLSNRISKLEYYVKGN